VVMIVRISEALLQVEAIEPVDGSSVRLLGSRIDPVTMAPIGQGAEVLPFDDVPRAILLLGASRR
jgi:hypothetical protein